MRWMTRKDDNVLTRIWREAYNRVWNETWHPWFAWYPVQIGDFWVWGEYVEQRRVMVASGPCGVPRWEYRALVRSYGLSHEEAHRTATQAADAAMQKAVDRAKQWYQRLDVRV